MPFNNVTIAGASSLYKFYYCSLVLLLFDRDPMGFVKKLCTSLKETSPSQAWTKVVSFTFSSFVKSAPCSSLQSQESRPVHFCLFPTVNFQSAINDFLWQMFF